MGRLNRDEVKVHVDGVIPYRNDKYAGIKILWSGNIGFGEYEVYSTSEYLEPIFENVPEEDQEFMYKKWNGQSECMDSNDDKWFIKKLLESLVEQMEIEE